MAHGELEERFARFRELGDVAALGQVFDAAAPKLLVLARHLAPDAACAEDLVEATFLAAIEHRERFDVDRHNADGVLAGRPNERDVLSRQGVTCPRSSSS